MSRSTVVLFTRFGLGQAPADLQQKMAGIFLSLLGVSDALPGKLLFYTDGVKLVCEGSPVLEHLPGNASDTPSRERKMPAIFCCRSAAA